MFEFLNKLFGRESSSAMAKERLRLVLLSDHLSLAPDVVESLKHDLVAVISRYVEVDAANCDVTFEQQDKQVAMLANIPILGMKSRPTPPAAPPGAPQPPPTVGNTAGASASIGTAPLPTSTVTEDSPPALASRRRRRKRRTANGGIAPQPG